MVKQKSELYIMPKEQDKCSKEKKYDTILSRKQTFFL